MGVLVIISRQRQPGAKVDFTRIVWLSINNLQLIKAFTQVTKPSINFSELFFAVDILGIL